ncbi:hypothetical protein RB2501_01435 [Robiginitalea biformata HTCC2501]|uniref:Uncharacterized protein n=2 Tax=Robiginitalea TaxID=252306 RepID=A4CPW2_ROBBH|nr:hypothetical protein RB2501_01435 [Robiginitalea biformata HTCC2501]
MGKVVKSLGKEEPAEMEGVTTRINKNGDRVYELQLDYLRGFIKGADLKLPPDEHPEYGKTMEFRIEAENGAQCVLQVPFDSAYGRGFLYAAPGIELDSPVEFEPYQYFSKKKGRDATGLSIIQHGEQLPWAYGTKKNPGGVPPLEKVTFKGKETWDNTKQLAFLEKKFLEFCSLFSDGDQEQPDPQPQAAPEPAPATAGPQDDF